MLTKQKKGRWTSLIAEELSFRKQVAHAIEVGSKIELISIPGMESEYSYVEIVVDNIPGWDEPLWATDDRWIFLRRPEGIWKTALPLQHLGRIGVVYQLGCSANKLGGTEIGRDFGSKEQWHFCRQPTEPSELDYPFGVDDGGSELGPMLIDARAGRPGALTLSAGPAFGTPPKFWRFDHDRLVATGQDGRVVVFPIPESLDLEPIAKAGKLWLRFEVLTHAWMEPFDAQVIL